RRPVSRCQTARRIANGELELWLRFHKPVAQASGSFSQACRLALGSFSQNAVSTRHSLLAPPRSRDALRPGFATFLVATRGVAERRETRGTMTRYPGVLVTRHAKRLRGAWRLLRETPAPRGVWPAG